MSIMRLYGPVAVVLAGGILRDWIGWMVASVLIVLALAVTLAVHLSENCRRKRERHGCVR